MREAIAGIPAVKTCVVEWMISTRRWDAWSELRAGWVVVVIVCVAIAHFFAMVRLIDGDFLNSYPYVTSDGFDYLYEGHALAARLAGLEIPPLLVLRNPGFVLVTTLDAALGAGGLVVAAVMAGAVLVAHLAMLAVGRALGASTAQVGVFVVASLTSTMGYYRAYVLADALAVALMLSSIWALVRYRQRDHSVRALVWASLAALLGALTQTYAAIPFLVGTGVFALEGLLREHRLRFELVWAVCALAALVAVVQWAWQTAIPHQQTPPNWAYLAFSFKMIGFYAKVWGYVFLPLIPLSIIAVMLVGGKRVLASPSCWFLGMTVLGFMLITFFYQWPDSRFTAVYEPIAFLTVLALVGIGTRPPAGDSTRPASDKPLQVLSLVTGGGLILQGLLIMPGGAWQPGIWQPDWRQAHVSPREAWIGHALSVAQPEDRFQLRERCGSTAEFCEGVEAPPGYEPYAAAILADYLRLEQLSTAPRPRQSP